MNNERHPNEGDPEYEDFRLDMFEGVLPHILFHVLGLNSLVLEVLLLLHLEFHRTESVVNNKEENRAEKHERYPKDACSEDVEKSAFPYVKNRKHVNRT